MFKCSCFTLLANTMLEQKKTYKSIKVIALR